MEDILDNYNKSETFSDKEIFTKIWFTPRKVFKFINDTAYTKFAGIIIVVAGISNAFDRASLKNMGEKQENLWVIIGMCIILGGLFSWITYYLYAALLSWTGKWLQGVANTSSLLNIISYASIPTIISLIILIPQIAFFGIATFQSDTDIMTSGIFENILYYGTNILQFILGIYVLVLSVIGISEVQKFSIGKAVLNLLLPMIVIIVPIIILVLIFTAS